MLQQPTNNPVGFLEAHWYGRHDRPGLEHLVTDPGSTMAGVRVWAPTTRLWLSRDIIDNRGAYSLPRPAWGIIPGRQRADGYIFKVYYSPDTTDFILTAGCRTFDNFDRARDHWRQKAWQGYERTLLDDWSRAETNRLENHLSLIRSKELPDAQNSHRDSTPDRDC